MEIELNESNFEEEVLESKIPVFVDFWAAWCMPCIAMGPVVSQMAEQFKGRLKVCKVNVDEAPGLAERFQIKNIPTMIVIKQGKETDRMIGMLPTKHIKESIETQIAC
jgi:thioredoxin 1